jgi:hypothetical protein
VSSPTTEWKPLVKQQTGLDTTWSGGAVTGVGGLRAEREALARTRSAVSVQP